MALLTKSRYTLGLQCLHHLWIKVNQKEKVLAFSDSAKAIIDQGNLVGELAKKLYPEGIDIPTDDFNDNIVQSETYIKQRQVLFEPGIMIDNLYSRLDILIPVGDDEWDILEVKASSSVKELNVHDVAFQRYCCLKSNMKIRKCFLVHLNKDFVKDGDIDVEKLFVKTDITEAVQIASKDIKKRVDNMKEVMSAKEAPPVNPEKFCKGYHDCFIEGCWDLPEHNVFELIRSGAKGIKLFNDGVLLIKDIPDKFKLSAKQQIQKDAVVSNKTNINVDEIKDFLGTLEYPLYYLDFETFNTAIPMFDGTKPYSQIPFQYSLHIQQEDGSISHHSFLASTKDPREDFVKSLKEVLGNSGSIVVYNEGFDKNRIIELATQFPDFKEWSEGVLSRVVDLIVPFRNLSYYNPSQRGGASIKKILPAITGKGYDDLAINNGGTASSEYFRVTFGEATDKDKAKVRKDLEEYCTLDTEGMVWIIDELRKLV